MRAPAGETFKKWGYTEPTRGTPMLFIAEADYFYEAMLCNGSPRMNIDKSALTALTA